MPARGVKMSPKLLYVIAALVLIGAIVPAQAAYSCNTTPDVDPFSGNAPFTISAGGFTQAQINSQCNACGYASTSPAVYMEPYNSDNIFISPYRKTEGLYGDWTGCTNDATRYVKRYGVCISGTVKGYVRLSDGACSANEAIARNSPDYLYREPREYFECTAGTLPNHTVDFLGTPRYGEGPLPVTLSDISTGYFSPTYNWTILPPTGWSVISGTINSKDVYINFVTNGNYSVSHGIQDAFHSGNLTRNDYIWVYNSTNQITTHAVARDRDTGFAIHRANVDMFDVENGSWTNTTAAPLGEGSITTLVGHHINLWGSASAYFPDNIQNADAIDGGYYPLLLQRTNSSVVASAGNLTLFVTVEELNLPHNTVSGAEVTASWGSQQAQGMTNAAGAVSFTVPNNTAIWLSTFKTGYASGSASHITGSANGGTASETMVMYIGTDYVTPTPTVTATGGGTVAPTKDPYPCIGDGSVQDTANCKRKQGEMGASLISYGPQLLLLFIALTFIGGAKLIGK
jgi:hypothetical protein